MNGNPAGGPSDTLDKPAMGEGAVGSTAAASTNLERTPKKDPSSAADEGSPASSRKGTGKRRGTTPPRSQTKKSRPTIEDGEGSPANGEAAGAGGRQASDTTSSDTHLSQQQQQQQMAAGQPHGAHRHVSHVGSHHAGEGGDPALPDAVFSPAFHLSHEHSPTSSRDTRADKEADAVASEGDEEFDANAENQPAADQQGGGTLMTQAHHYRMAQQQGQQVAASGSEQQAEQQEDDDECVDFDPLLFIKQLPQLDVCIPKFRSVVLPKKTRQCKRKTLVLDLDETLVHSSLEAVEKCDFSFPVSFNNMEHTVYVRQRPHLAEFMERVSQLFEVVVFTASQKIYAERLLNILDPQHRLVKHRVYRDSCVVVDGNYLKDLTILGRDLSQMAIVDNSPQAFGFQVDNGIPIESWYEDETDEELMHLLPFLEKMADVEDVRPLIRDQYRLQELIDQA